MMEGEWWPGYQSVFQLVLASHLHVWLGFQWALLERLCRKPSPPSHPIGCDDDGDNVLM